MDEVIVRVTFSSNEMKRIAQDCTILNYLSYEQKQQFLEGFIHGVISKHLIDLGIPYDEKSV